MIFFGKFWDYSGNVLGHFWNIFGGFFGEIFGKMLGSFGNIFGAIWRLFLENVTRFFFTSKIISVPDIFFN